MFTLRQNSAFFVVAVLFNCAPALAVPVFPLHEVIEDNLLIPSTAEVVATRDHALTLTYEGLPEGATLLEENTLDATLHTQVLRDPLTQRLTFVYRVTPVEFTSLAEDASSFIMGNFGTFSADLTGEGTWTAFRTVDGDRIITESAAGGLPYFAVATDATEFDSGGEVTFHFTETFGITFADPNDPSPPLDQRALSVDLTTGGIFQPVIPLPAGVWLGLVALAGSGAALRLRRRLRLI